MDVRLAVDILQDVLGASTTELSPADVFLCTQKMAQKVNTPDSPSSEVVQAAIAKHGGMFRTGATTFSLNLLPCIWADLGIVDFSQQCWGKVSANILLNMGASDQKSDSMAPPIKISGMRKVHSRCWDESSLGSGRSGICDAGLLRGRAVARRDAESSSSSISSSRRTVDSTTVSALEEQMAQQKETISLLQSVIMRNGIELQEAKSRLKAALQTNRRYEDKLSKVQQQLGQEKVKFDTDFSLSKTSDFRNASRAKHKTDSNKKKDAWEWLTPQGSIALGIRRNLSNISCSDIGLTLLDDISRWTVARMEVKVSACMVSDAVKFFDAWKSDKLLSRANNSEAVLIASFRQDATNSGIFNRSKLIALELDASFTCTLVPSGAYEAPKWHRLKRMGDVQVVKEGTGAASLSLTKKMLNGLGCPLWKGDNPTKEDDDLAPDVDASPDSYLAGLFLLRFPFNSNVVRIGQCHVDIRNFCVSRDAGYVRKRVCWVCLFCWCMMFCCLFVC